MIKVDWHSGLLATTSTKAKNKQLFFYISFSLIVKDDMCKVYNQIGCLTAVKSHLEMHNVNEYKSITELINFQNSYTADRQQIVANHEILIEQEQNTLSDELIQILSVIDSTKNEVEQQLLLKQEKLKQRLDNLPVAHSNYIGSVVNYFKKSEFKFKIQFSKLSFKFKVQNSIKDFVKIQNIKSKRHQFIVTLFKEAVLQSGYTHLQEIDRRKEIVDQINNSIYGALGEHEVVKELKRLSDDHILINDFNLIFNKPLYNRYENDYIKSVQIDHILVSPSGVFLIETKNWSKRSLANLSLHSPVHQIKRARFALSTVLNGGVSRNKLNLNKHHWGDRKIPVKNLIVFTNHKPIEEFQDVKILTVNNLFSYISYLSPCFKSGETQTIANYLLKAIGK
ncbi:NERD domain-containing protein [Mucilaginibacter sp. RB4R14]|uniref:nuclease-related domain-containing protein n=1 Tax=Mucilaginibacter aurantiaciroseus TaxID=2949308 RepID=UPI0020902D34|nr:NERD domain-containing protein [Mucilaginibacter aurantiaciroseus]